MDAQITQHFDFPNFPLADLHVHSRPSISPAVYWRLAHEQGFKLPTKDYYEFEKYVKLSPTRQMSINDYFKKIYHPLFYKISSGTMIQEKAFYEIFTGAYRNNIHLFELHTNIMKVNQNGEQDLDAIVMAMLRGMERALLEYPKLSAGLIFSVAREMPFEGNIIMIEKAMRYHKRGVVGIDFEGPANPNFHYKDYADIVKKARKTGLKVTAHTGELPEANDIREVLEYIKPDRIGHGWLATQDKEVMQELAKRETVIEFCPMSNIITKFQTLEDIKHIIYTFMENNVKFTINTDWPEMMEGAHLWRQYKMLYDAKILSEKELKNIAKTAFQASFIPHPGGLKAYL